MKILSLLVIATVSFTSSFAQKIDQKFNFKKIDTLTVLKPIGNISISNNHSISPDETLSEKFSVNYLTVLSENVAAKVHVVSSSGLENEDTQRYFYKLMERVEKLDHKTFTKVKIGEKIKSMIANEPGRYFCFNFFSGLEVPQHLTSSIDKTSSGLYFPLATERSFFKNYVLVVDKKTEKVIYFHHSKTVSSVESIDAIKLQVHKLFQGYLEKDAQ